MRLTGQDTIRGTFSQRHLRVRLEDRRAATRRSRTSRRDRPVRAPQQPAVRDRVPRVRVRLQRPGPRRARDVGGAVRRLRQQRAGDRRPVPRLGPREMGADLAPDAVASARLRGLGARALARPPRALPAARRRGKHPRLELPHPGAVLPPAAPPGADLEGAPADRDDTEEPAAAPGGDLDARRAERRRVPEGDRRPAVRGRPGGDARRSRSSCSARARSTTTSSATRSVARPRTSPSRASSCSTRSPTAS